MKHRGDREPRPAAFRFRFLPDGRQAFTFITGPGRVAPCARSTGRSARGWRHPSRGRASRVGLGQRRDSCSGTDAGAAREVGSRLAQLLRSGSLSVTAGLRSKGEAWSHNPDRGNRRGRNGGSTADQQGQSSGPEGARRIGRRRRCREPLDRQVRFLSRRSARGRAGRRRRGEVWTRGVFRATHAGDWPPHPATGRFVEMRYMATAGSSPTRASGTPSSCCPIRFAATLRSHARRDRRWEVCLKAEPPAAYRLIYLTEGLRR